jgi:hypothetical protein
MAERIEVGAQLHRPGHDLGHPVDLVLADRGDGVRVVCGRDERLAEVAAGEDRDRLVEDAAEVVHAPMPHRGEGLQALRLVDVVEHPDLVAGAERRRPPDRLRLLDGCHSDDQGSRKSA